MSKQSRREIIKKQQRRKQTRIAMLLVTVVVACFAFVMVYQMQEMRVQDSRYAVQEAGLRAELEAEEERAEDLEESRAYMKTDEYIEQIAREKLGLVNPDETVVKAR